MRLAPALRAVAATLGQSLATLAFVIVLVFALVRVIPGDPVEAILGSQASPEDIAALGAELGLDRPVSQQFKHYVGLLAHGDLGGSAAERGTSVASIVAHAWPITLFLVMGGLLGALLLGIPAGLWAGVTQQQIVDGVLRLAATSLTPIPSFLIGLLLILGLAVRHHWLPAGGWGDDFPSSLPFAILPILALSLHGFPPVFRVVRRAAINTRGQLFLEAATARGLGMGRVLLGHYLPNCLPPVITLVGATFGGILTGAAIVEAVFGISGMGTELMRAIARRDYPVIQGIALVSAATVIAVNLLSESARVLLDPRSRRAT